MECAVASVKILFQNYKKRQRNATRNHDKGLEGLIRTPRLAYHSVLRIQEVPGSILAPDIGHPHNLSWLSSVFLNLLEQYLKWATKTSIHNHMNSLFI